MKTDLIKVLNDQNVKAEAPVIRIGDTVRVHIKIKEGAKERIQIFEGTVIAKKHGGVNETFTVRRISYGVGVEKVFPVHSPTWFRWKPSARARCVVQSCTTCVAVLARLQRSRPSCNFC